MRVIGSNHCQASALETPTTSSIRDDQLKSIAETIPLIHVASGRGSVRGLADDLFRGHTTLYRECQIGA